ncbi:unnamed protein product [Lupinus luteus]|uniref:DNA-directed RNA polymerase subunit n=1 Tax=Lupinus luteus TaxID=3873 RepID=A0AAV1WVY1_LUPLU
MSLGSPKTMASFSLRLYQLVSELSTMSLGRKAGDMVVILALHCSPETSESRRNYQEEEITMFLKVQLPWNVIIAAENLQPESLMLQRSIVICLLSDFAIKKATKDLGYYLAVTTLETIGEGKVRLHTGDVLFPVVFNAITFKILKGEILEGVVHKVLKHGVFMRCGPIENVYLSNLKMPGYHYVPGENPCFMNEKMSKVGKDVRVRFVVIGTKWMEAEREFQALVSLEGDYLGPISSPDI